MNCKQIKYYHDRSRQNKKTHFVWKKKKIFNKANKQCKPESVKKILIVKYQYEKIKIMKNLISKNSSKRIYTKTQIV